MPFKGQTNKKYFRYKLVMPRGMCLQHCFRNRSPTFVLYRNYFVI